jgi:CheY-like chemotaxis protein
MPNSNLKVLVVDDERDLVDITAELLETQGFVTLRAYSGKEALKMYQESPTDLILSDIRMPNGDGVWLLKEIRKLPNQPLGFAFMSAFSDHGRDDLLRMGADELFPKPVDASSLVTFLRARPPRP